jgi:CRP-like cAMP-binding protein
MEELFDAHPDLLVDIARSLSFKIRLLISQIWIMASDDSESKIGKVLYLLSRDSRKQKMTIPMTHQALADIAVSTV